LAVGLLDPDYGTDTFSDNVDKLLTSAHKFPEVKDLKHCSTSVKSCRLLGYLFSIFYGKFPQHVMAVSMTAL